MSGIKGRSGGKATTIEEKQAKSAATAAREARKREIAATKRKLGQPVTYGDLLKSAQVDGELLQNDRRAIEVQRAEVELARAKDERDTARGLLRTRDEHLDAVRAITGEIIARLSIIVDAAVNLHQPEQQPGVRHKMDAAANQLRTEVSAIIKGLK